MSPWQSLSQMMLPSLGEIAARPSKPPGLLMLAKLNPVRKIVSEFADRLLIPLLVPSSRIA